MFIFINCNLLYRIHVVTFLQIVSKIIILWKSDGKKYNAWHFSDQKIENKIEKKIPRKENVQ